MDSDIVSSLIEIKGSYMIILRFFSIMFSFIDTEEDFYCLSYIYFEIDVCLKGNEKDCIKGYERKRERDSNVSEKAEGSKKEEVSVRACCMDSDIVSSLIEIKGNEKDCIKGYERKRERDSNVSEKAEGSKKEEVVKKAGNYNTKKKTQTLPERRPSSTLAQRINKSNVQSSPVTRSKRKKVIVEEEEEEGEEEEEVRERRSKNKHDGGSRENVKNTRSSAMKGKDKVVEEAAKGKISVRGKKVVVEFEKPSPSTKQKGKGKEVKKAKKEVIKKPKEETDFPSMKNKCSPIALISIIHGLSKDQKNCVRDMGLGTVLQSKLMDVPMKMCYYVLERLNVEKMVVVVEKGELKVNAESIHDMLGLPIGGTLFKDMPVVVEDDEDSCMFEWKNQYENTKDLRLKQLKNEILLTREGDLNFRINFLTKKAYNPEKESSFFFGPAAYLALLYVDGLRFERMDVPRTRPAICFWSSEMIRVREDYEMIDGGFGLGEVNGKFVEDFVDISDDDEEDREYEEEVQEEVEEDSEVESCEESFEIKIKHMFERMEYILETLNELVDRAIERYPENQSFQNWKSKISIPENQFEFAAEYHHDEDAVISTLAFGQDGEEERDDDDDEEDGNDNEGNDDDHDDDGNDENEDEDVGGNGANEEELNDLNNVVDNVVESALGSQFSIQVTQVESLNVQSSTETERVDDVSEVAEVEVKQKLDELEKRNEDVVEGNEKESEDENVKKKEKEKESVENEVEVGNVKDKDDVVEQEDEIQKGNEDENGNEDDHVVEEQKKNENNVNLSIVVGESSNVEVPDDAIDTNPVSFVPLYGTEAIVVPFNDVLVDAVPVCVVPSCGTNTRPSEPKPKQKREKKPSMALMSPFKERIVDPRSALTPDENAICEWLFSLRGEPMDEIYNYNGRAISFRGVFESLYSRTYIHSGVLGAWSDYLNEKEKERDVMNSPFRLFMKPDICLSLENESVSEEKKYEIFKENFKAGVYGDKDLLLLKGVDLIFFPIIRSEHIYLFVFNLRKPAYEGLDNSADDAEFLDKYGAVFVPLKMFFLKYLFEIGHQKAFDMSQEELTPRRIKLPWRTIYNKYDCGVFTMRHMETYFGESAASKWKPGFTKEGNFQNKLLEKLREKYAATLLLWRMNTKSMPVSTVK
ncbi:hypothetical protein LXL04_028786 [Taraxacum kok-saghyz]